MRLSDEAPTHVNDLMTSDLLKVKPGDLVDHARDLLLTIGIHALPVMDGNEVVGIVTSADLTEGWNGDEPVSAVMTRAPVTIDLGATIGEAAETMIGSRIHHLLVTDDAEVVGILSSLDLLRVLVVTPRD